MRKKTPKIFFALLVLLLSTKSGVLADGGLPLTFLGARPLGWGEEAFIPRYSVTKIFGLLTGSMPVADPSNQKMTVEALPFMYGKGISKDLTLVLALPYVNKVMQSQVGTHKVQAADSGAGDLQLLGLFRLWSVDYGPDNTTLSVLFGSSIPTGSSAARDGQGNILPPSLQLGLGSPAPLFGVAYTSESTIGQTDFQVTYQLGFTNAQGFNPGNGFGYNLRYGYRLFPRERFKGNETYVALELNGAETSQGFVNGRINPNSGGSTIFLTPVLQQVANENLLLEFGYGFPVLRNLTGTQLAPQNAWIFGLRYIR